MKLWKYLKKIPPWIYLLIIGFVTFYQTRLEVSTDMSWYINAALNIFILGRGGSLWSFGGFLGCPER
jgi:hypothetical protein